MAERRTMSHVEIIKTESTTPATSDRDWSCLGAISIDQQNLLVFWECTWHSTDAYHSLHRDGHRGWLVHAQEQDRLLIAWEPTLERKSIQYQPSALLLDPAREVRRGRPGLLGYVAAKYLHAPSNGDSQRLAFLAYWRIAPMQKEVFGYLQETFSSHRGSVVHTEENWVWVQWEPTWVFFEDLGKRRMGSHLQLHNKPEALLRGFHKAVVDYSSSLAVQRRILPRC